MIPSRVLVWIVLISLGVAALLGAAGVLMGGQDFYWRAVGTLIVTAICSALLFWVTRRLTDPSAAAAAALATTLIVLIFILSLTAIWEINEKFFNIGDEYVVELIFMIAVLAIPAVTCVRYLLNPQGIAACITGLILCVAVFVFWAIAMAHDNREKYWETGNTIAGFGFLMTLSLVGIGTDRRYWRWLGVIAAVVGGTVGIWFIWKIGYYYFWPHNSMAALVGVAIWIAHANLTVRCPLKSGQKWIAYASMAAVFFSMAFWNAAVLASPGQYQSQDDMLGRLSAACGIIGACGSIALIILWRTNQKLVLEKRQLAEALNVSTLQVAVVCPTCQRKLTIGTAATSCPGCGLQMKLILEEPRCQSCGYSLLMISSDRCPECGAPKAALPIAAAT